MLSENTENLQCNNLTINTTLSLDYNLTTTPIVITGSIVFIVILPLVLFHIKPFPLGTTSAVLLGAMLMVLCQVIDQIQVYGILGRQDNLTTILLLLGMMLIAQYFEREGLLELILKFLLKDHMSFYNYIWRVCLLSALLSALFTNDASCAIITPVLLKYWQKEQRSIIELELLVLGIATSANIGSVTTIFGNPQMALIAAKTSLRLYYKSQLDLVTCFMYLVPAAVLGFALNVVFLMIYYKIKISCLAKTPANMANIFLLQSHKLDNKNCDNLQTIDNSCAVAMHSGTDSCTVHRRHSCPILHISSEKFTNVTAQNYLITGLPKSNCLFLSNYNNEVDNTSKNIPKVQMHDIAEEFSPSKSKPFIIIMCCMLLLTVVLFLSSGHPVVFDIGLVPVGAALVIITADAVINRRSALHIIHRVDWSIILMFLGIFVWMDGINITRLPRWIWKHLGLAGADYAYISTIAMLSGFVIIGSNIFSNVPLTIIILEQLEPCQDQLRMVLLLSWCATIAGNLTLFGSVANLIVADKTLQTVNFRLTFWRYLRFGLPTSVIIIFVGLLVLNGLLYFH